MAVRPPPNWNSQNLFRALLLFYFRVALGSQLPDVFNTSSNLLRIADDPKLLTILAPLKSKRNEAIEEAVTILRVDLGLVHLWFCDGDSRQNTSDCGLDGCAHRSFPFPLVPRGCGYGPAGSQSRPRSQYPAEMWSSV